MVKRSFLFWQLALAVLLIDQLTKWAVVATMQVSQSVTVIPKVFSLTSIRNTGAGFGILQDQNAFLIIVALAAIVIIIASLRKILEEHHTTLFSALILGGAAGNLIDRIVYKSVVDFFDFHIWPAFNIADAALTIGVLGLIWLALIEKKKS
ncbi:signal peptidase II [Candidatus Woesearchaeota archaeon]|nr:signal peptidase II [Candidatus Woesearchaeota archaeon]